MKKSKAFLARDVQAAPSKKLREDRSIAAKIWIGLILAPAATSFTSIARRVAIHLR
jgi:hypothetical protein